ncbi:MAG: dihydropteroate synthase [Planctomycetota bacterium]|nr:dihydropteroate synthase [Planctomycetota bacterium]
MTQVADIPRWCLGSGRSLLLDRPRLMAVVNTTPDSFFAGSRTTDVHTAVEMAAAAVRDGADMLDIGGESTRPGAERVPQAEQIDRVVPVIAAIRATGDPLATIPISVDTTLPGVARAAIEAGADAINDVSAGAEGGGGGDMLDLAASSGAGLVLMHRLVPPDRDSFSDRYEQEPEYDDVVVQVRDALLARAVAAEAAGVRPEAILLDPGLGFGKTVEQNLDLVRRGDVLVAGGYPVLSAASRKSFVGRVSDPDTEQTAPEDRLPGSVACSVLHLAAGARVFRVHDVGPQRAALAAAWAIVASLR